MIHTYKKGDIGVRLDNSRAFNRNEHPIGRMYEAVKTRSAYGFEYGYGSCMFHSHVRPATPEEVRAYERGIRHIKDIKPIKELDYEIY